MKYCNEKNYQMIFNINEVQKFISTQSPMDVTATKHYSAWIPSPMNVIATVHERA